jgi:transcriptional regulatory protein RtcR
MGRGAREARPGRPACEAIGFYGTTKDGSGVALERRPTFRLCNDPALPVARLHLLHSSRYEKKVAELADELQERSASRTKLVPHQVHCDPWDLGAVEKEVTRLAQEQGWGKAGPERLVHLTTGTDAAKSVLVLMARRGHIAGARLVETERAGALRPVGPGSQGWSEHGDRAGMHVLGGMVPQAQSTKELTRQVLEIARRSGEPILLLGPPGTGKSELAGRIEETKVRERKRRADATVTINCGALDSELLRSELFGHEKGAFTGATKKKFGLLKLADGGVVFLDEVGELDLIAQAQLLRALEEKAFLPVGGAKEERSHFELVAATNQDLAARVREGTFREDLLGRISTWTFTLPTLRERLDDLQQLVQERHLRPDGAGEGADGPSFDKDAWRAYEAFARSAEARWPGNLRDLRSSVRRMRDLAEDNLIRRADVEAEVERLRRQWATLSPSDPRADRGDDELLREHDLDPSRMHQLEAHRAAHVIRQAWGCQGLADLGRRLYRDVENPASYARKLLNGIERDGAAGEGTLVERLFPGGGRRRTR